MSRVAGGAGLVGVADLDPEAVYLSPLDRRCRFVPMETRPSEVAHFVYDTAQGQPAHGAFADGFALTAGNVCLMRLMRRVA